METKKYSGKSFQNAVEKAKLELGEDIIIIDTKEVTSGGFLSEEKKMVEILVSESEPETEAQETEAKEQDKQESQQKNKAILPKKVGKNLQYTYLTNELEKLNDY